MGLLGLYMVKIARCLFMGLLGLYMVKVTRVRENGSLCSFCKIGAPPHLSLHGLRGKPCKCILDALNASRVMLSVNTKTQPNGVVSCRWDEFLPFNSINMVRSAAFCETHMCKSSLDPEGRL